MNNMVNKLLANNFFIKVFLLAFCMGFFNLFSFHINAQEGYQIDIDLDNFNQEEIIFAYEFLDRYPVVDTIRRNDVGNFQIKADSSLIPGIYLLVLPPNNDFVTLLINEDEQQFSVKADVNDLSGSMQITGSPDNKMYYEYMNYLNTKVGVLNQFRAAADATEDVAEKFKNKEAFQKGVDEIRDYQFGIIKNHPESFTAALIKSEIEYEIPEYDGSPQEVQYLKYSFRKKHYFDMMDLADPRLLRSEILFTKVFYYLDNLTPKNIDSLNVAIDKVLSLVKPAPKTFKYYLDHIMITYASSDIVGMDGVYVHVVDKYYSKELTPWVAEDDLAEMKDDISRRKNILIGKIAPDIKMQLKDGTPINLHDVDADYTVVYLWQPGCSHCKKSMPFMKDFYTKFKDKGVELFTGCTKITKKVPECWKYVEENELGDWLNTVDPYLQSRFVQIYMAEKTPKIFILDDEKRIIMKDIDATQLEDIMNSILEENKKSNVPAGRS